LNKRKITWLYGKMFRKKFASITVTGLHKCFQHNMQFSQKIAANITSLSDIAKLFQSIIKIQKGQKSPEPNPDSDS
jgi:hypothetical protein